MGQTKKLLKTRHNKRKNNIKLNSKYHNVGGKHIIENCNHNFVWEKIRIIHKENNLSKRLIAELIYLKIEKDNSLNKMSDCDNLSESYIPLISDISHCVKLLIILQSDLIISHVTGLYFPSLLF